MQAIAPGETPPTPASDIQRALLGAGSVKKFLEQFSSDERELLLYRWRAWARDNQKAPPGDWLTWLIITGRGWGKTRTAAEWIRERVDSYLAERIGLVARTPADGRDVMVEGDSGILSVFPPHQRPHYEPSKRRITFYTGAVATVYSSENPDQLRGPQHDTMWWDELATFKGMEAWENGQFGLRLGRPKQVVTTTPRPIRIVRELVREAEAKVKDPKTGEDTDEPVGKVVMTTGSTYENQLYLADSFLGHIRDKYEGTRLGEQEIKGKVLEEVPGSLWTRQMIRHVADYPELFPNGELPTFQRVVVGVDPSVSEGEHSAECGIVVAAEGVDGRFFVLADRSIRATPAVWARQVMSCYYGYHAVGGSVADRVVAETNQGGKLVELTMRTVDPNVSYRGVWASTGKEARAEPVSALYEKDDRVFHAGVFEDLEDQLCSWVPGQGESPDRLDALVWAFYELGLKPAYTGVID